jgi:hypothetical protein
LITKESQVLKNTGLYAAMIAAFVPLTACVTDGQGHVVMDPNVSATISAAFVPPPPPAPVPVVAEVYEPMPYDAAVVVVADRDVVFVGGSTYIWVTGPDGIRHRQFYAHGDHRADVFHRRDELRAVMARHDGHLPDHAIGPQHSAGVAHGPIAARGPNVTPAHPAPQSKSTPAEKQKT